MEFIDVVGASGTPYRFRRWPGAGRHPPIAGNYVLFTERGQKLVAVGAVEDLSRAPELLVEPMKGAVLFTRLNIARRVREAEHLDLAAAHPELAGEPRLA